jgi:hypothetical protein
MPFHPDYLMDRYAGKPISLGQALNRLAMLIGSKNLAVSHRCFLKYQCDAPRFPRQA